MMSAKVLLGFGRRWRESVRTPVILLGLIAGVLPIAIAWRFGALGIPRNDDWSYVVASFRFADGGGIDGNDWALMHLVGQLAISLPVNLVFGNRIAPLQVLVAFMGVAGLLSGYLLATRWLTRPRALFAMVLVAVGPMWAALAGSFMTDVPTLSLSMICLAAGTRALESPTLSRTWLATSMAIGLVGFAIRQYAIVAILAVIGASLWHTRTPDRRRVSVIAITSVITLMLAGLFYLWWRGLPGFDNPPLRMPNSTLIQKGVDRSLRSAVLVGFLIFPALLVARPVRILREAWNRSPVSTTATAGMIAAMFGTWSLIWHRNDLEKMIGPGNYVIPQGVLGSQVIEGHRPSLLPNSLMTLFALIGIVTLAILLVSLVSALPHLVRSLAIQRSSGNPSLTVAVLALVGFSLACAAPTFFGMPLFDRYLLPIVALSSVLVSSLPLHPRSDRAVVRWMPGLATAGLAAVGLVFACNSASFDGARWRAAERAAEIIGDPHKVNGGFEWTNYLAESPVYFSPEIRSEQYCVILRIRADSIPEWQELAEEVWAPFGNQAWIVAEQRSSC